MWYKSQFFMFCVFFFNDTATTEIYTLSLHDALPISFEQTWTSSNTNHLAAQSKVLAQHRCKI